MYILVYCLYLGGGGLHLATYLEDVYRLVGRVRIYYYRQ